MGFDLDDEFFELREEKTPEEIQQELSEFLKKENEYFEDWKLRNPDFWAVLKDKVSDFRIYASGGVFPFQAFGSLAGFPFYYRERGGVATLKVSDFSGESQNYGFNFDNLLYNSWKEVEEFRDCDEYFVETFLELVEKLEKAPFKYEFSAKHIAFKDETTDINAEGAFWASDNKVVLCAWGVTPEEAYESTKQVSLYLLDHRWSEEVQTRMWKMREIDSEPLNEDNRVFPDPEPDFKSLLKN